jgi:hypothetical protein
MYVDFIDFFYEVNALEVNKDFFCVLRTFASKKKSMKPTYTLQKIFFLLLLLFDDDGVSFTPIVRNKINHL